MQIQQLQQLKAILDTTVSSVLPRLRRSIRLKGGDPEKPLMETYLNLTKALALADHICAHEQADEIESKSTWTPNFDNIQCVCGGLAEEFRSEMHRMFRCNQCSRMFETENSVLASRQDQAGQLDSLNFYRPEDSSESLDDRALDVVVEVNGKSLPVKPIGGKYTVSYEQVVRNAVTGTTPADIFSSAYIPDSDLPDMVCVYRHSNAIPFPDVGSAKIAPLEGRLGRGETVEVTPGMAFVCVPAEES